MKHLRAPPASTATPMKPVPKKGDGPAADDALACKVEAMTPADVRMTPGGAATPLQTPASEAGEMLQPPSFCLPWTMLLMLMASRRTGGSPSGIPGSPGRDRTPGTRGRHPGVVKAIRGGDMHWDQEQGRETTMVRGWSQDLEPQQHPGWAGDGVTEADQCEAALKRAVTSDLEQHRPSCTHSKLPKDQQPVAQPAGKPKPAEPKPIETISEIPAANPKPEPADTTSEIPAANQKSKPTDPDTTSKIPAANPLPVDTTSEIPAANQKSKPTDTISEIPAANPLPVDTTSEIPAANQESKPTDTTSEIPAANPVPMDATSQIPATNQIIPAASEPAESKPEDLELSAQLDRDLAELAAKLDKDDPDAWRKDRKGQWLKPHALYMRFYRSIRKEGTSK